MVSKYADTDNQSVRRQYWMPTLPLMRATAVPILNFKFTSLCVVSPFFDVGGTSVLFNLIRCLQTGSFLWCFDNNNNNNNNNNSPSTISNSCS
jgi:hypothetical protein